MYNFTDDPSYLQHFGIKGMKWGVRRYRKEDGSLTAAGKKKRYKNNAPNTSEKSKSKRQLELEEKYQKEYKLTKEEAELAAYQKIKTDRLIKIAAGVGVAALAGYIAYRHYDNTVDRFIKGDLQTISRDNLDINRPFYASHNVYDKLVYRGGYAQALRKGNKEVIKNVVGIKGKGLKVASRKTATEHVNQLIKNDPRFKKQLEGLLYGLEFSTKNNRREGRYRMAKKAAKEIDSGKISQKTYDLINMYFGESNVANVESPIYKDLGSIRSRIFESLNKEGYGAIKDMHNARYGGYRSIDPIIVFGKSDLDKPVSEVFSKKDAKKDIAIFQAKEFISTIAPGTLLFGGSKKAISVYNRKKDAEFVRDYRREHPNTKLSFNEIVRQKDAK